MNSSVDVQAIPFHWLIIGGIILLVIPNCRFVPLQSFTTSGNYDGDHRHLRTDFIAQTGPQAPSFTVAINGQKMPLSSIHLQVMANTYIPGDVTGLRVSLNGAQKGMLDGPRSASG